MTDDRRCRLDHDQFVVAARVGRHAPTPPGPARRVTGVPASRRAFVLRHTRLRPVPGVDEISLHLADEVLPLWHALQVETRDPEAGLPYWAFAWAGGMAIARHLREQPEMVAGRRVFDLAAGSGLCAIAAMRAGAVEATSADVDPFAIAAVMLNSRGKRLPDRQRRARRARRRASGRRRHHGRRLLV